MKERLIWIDILNITAIIGVIIMHCNPAVHSFSGAYDRDFMLSAFVHSTLLWPVNVFFMLTGVTLIGYKGDWKHFYKRRIKRTLVPYLFWTLFYIIISKQYNSPYNILDSLINGKAIKYLWFFIPLFGIYLTMPIYNKIIENKRVTKYVICGSLVYLTLAKSLYLLNIEETTFFPLSQNYFWAPLLGWYIVKSNICEKKKIIYILGGLCMFINFVGLLLFCSINNDVYRIFLSYENPLCIMTSVFVFVVVKNTDWNRILYKLHINNTILSVVSSCTLGIYLLHAFILLILRWHFPIDLNLPLYGFLLVYPITLFLVYLLKKIPIINNIVP